MNSKGDVLFDAERMKYPNTGLFHFCMELGNAIRLSNEQNLSKLNLGFYLPTEQQGCFGNKVKYVKQHSVHKFFFNKNKDFNIWHSTYQGSQYFPINSKTKIIQTVHDMNFLYDLNASGEKVKKHIARLQNKIDRADIIVSISNFVASDIIKHINLKGKKVNVIYNGCNVYNNLQGDFVSNVKGSSKPFLFSIGTIAPKKNFHELPKLLINNDYNLIIAGVNQNENYRIKIIETAKEYGVEDRVYLVGPISELDKYWLYKNCLAFCLLSLSEGFGLPVTEAMFFNAKLLLTNLTSLPEIGGENATYIDNFDIDYMQKKLEECLSIKNLDYSKHLKKFNWNVAANQYLEMYNTL